MCDISGTRLAPAGEGGARWSLHPLPRVRTGRRPRRLRDDDRGSMNTHERRRLAALRTDRETVLAAAAALRHEAVQAHYAGLSRPEIAFGLASVLEMLALRIADQPPDIRAHVVRIAREMAGDTMDSPTVRRTRRR